ncbi:hypothetical protein ACE5IS_11370 [Leptospira wolffii]|uniref:Uncharacterized protein n=1 Tax=Leptospira wolffii TaxID=409998 RepID=A0ABV5BP36_9LEPT|nr:hypothetical protein [Leptospira wolffii]TGL47513.1 hypothetical protein EHQ61_15510 [Leptospira wolffii]
MSESDTGQQGFPFHPLQDFVLGEVLDRTLQRLGIPKPETETAILSHLPTGKTQFVFTPNAKKQIQLQSMPVELRGFLESGKDSEIVRILRKTIQEEGRLDLALELIEWIFTGFENEQLVRSLFSLVLNDKIPLPTEFYSILKEEYDKEMRGDLDRLKEE